MTNSHDQSYNVHEAKTHLSRLLEAAVAGEDIVVARSAPGGGPSGGLTYLIGYLNDVSAGAFTADVGVAATGALEPEGAVAHVKGVDEKLGAASLAGVDVLFVPSAPSHRALAEHAERLVGFGDRPGAVSAPIAEERRLDDYEAWGATPPGAMDVVVVGHIADVAAYLCGASSVHACSVAEHLGALTTSETTDWYDTVRRVPAPDGGRVLGPLGSGGPQ